MAEFEIIPYQPHHEDALQALERASPQGKWVQLGIERTHFLSRSEVFGRYAVFLAIAPGDAVSGVLGAASVPLRINGEETSAGMVYDVRVADDYRNRGIAKHMLEHARDCFFRPNGLQHIISTAKASNTAVLRVSKILKTQIFEVPFVYLTIPSHRRLESRRRERKAGTSFVPVLFGDEDRLRSCITRFDAGPALWHTHRMYWLTIRRLHPAVRLAVRIANLFPRTRNLPTTGDVLRFGMLFDTGRAGAENINEVLEYLQKSEVGFLSVCCRRGDRIHRLLKPLAINAYPYLFLSTLPVSPTDELEIDVRCL